MKSFKNWLNEINESAKKTYKYYVLENGKGYLKVTVKEIEELDLLDKISSKSSYDSNKTHIFLDDTSSGKTDMDKFLEALGEDVNIITIDVFPYRSFGNRFGARGFLPCIADWRGIHDNMHTGNPRGHQDMPKGDMPSGSIPSSDAGGPMIGGSPSGGIPSDGGGSAIGGSDAGGVVAGGASAGGGE